MKIRKVLVANRGEIAVRIIRALREATIPSVAVYSDADRASLHVRMADKAADIWTGAVAESYLRIDKLLAAAKQHGADAIHPGYGFLSENADFADACAAAGLIFIGPSGDSIRRLGSKTSARELAMTAGVPVLPGTIRGVSTYDEAEAVAQQIGYPGHAEGRGRRRRERHAPRRRCSRLAGALRDASSEAERAFGNGEVYVEKLIEKPRHIEIQVLGDQPRQPDPPGRTGVFDTAPASEGHRRMPVAFCDATNRVAGGDGSAAVNVAAAAGYYNAGTVEFLVDSATGAYYFLEMNTRLQVEHPVTELVTGLDLVQLQLRIAAGEPLSSSKRLSWTGAAIECRLGAEDPDNQFFPSPGLITDLAMPSGPGIRLDSGDLRRLDGADGIRSASGEARRLGAHRGGRDRPHAAGARRMPYRRNQEQRRLSSATSCATRNLRPARFTPASLRNSWRAVRRRPSARTANSPRYWRRSPNRAKRKRRPLPRPPNSVLNGCAKDARTFCVRVTRLREAPCNPASR